MLTLHWFTFYAKICVQNTYFYFFIIFFLYCFIKVNHSHLIGLIFFLQNQKNWNVSLKTKLATSKQRKNKRCKGNPWYRCQDTCWFPELDLYVYRLKASLRARLSLTAGPLTLLINLR